MNYVGRPAWRNQWLAILIAILLFLAFISTLVGVSNTETPDSVSLQWILLIIFILAILVILYRRYSWKFTIASDTIESRHGIIARNIKSVRIKDLRNVNLKQSIFQRIFGVGNLEFSSAGGSGIEVTFHGITNPMSVKNQVQTLQDKA
ncbi:MAG: PH domain-containing protein [Deltaproteobacteria bacterium]|nr:PH domain-containing protein [Deltaproteobacteria bacterium]